MKTWWVKKLTKILDSQYNLYEKMEIDALLSNPKDLEKIDRYVDTKTIDPLLVRFF